MTEILLPSRYLLAAAIAVSKDKFRSNLAGVYLDPRGFIVATDGLVAFAARCAELKGGPSLLIPPSAILAAKKGKSETFVLSFASDVWWLSNGLAKTHFDPIREKFPQRWDRVWPAQTKTFGLRPAHFSPAVYAQIGAMAAALGSPFHIYHDAAGPCPVTFAGDEDALAVAMPMPEKDVLPYHFFAELVA